MPEEFRDSIDAGAGDAVPDAVDIGTATAAPEPARAPGKRRGRPPGSGAGSGKSTGTAKEKARHSLDLSSLTGLFVGLHVVAASVMNTPELALDMAEGDQFMKSAQNVMRHYSVESSQKTIDWLAFGGTCCLIYGTRFGAYMLRKRTELKDDRRPVIYTQPTFKETEGQVKGGPVHAVQSQEQHFEATPEYDGQE